MPLENTYLVKRLLLHEGVGGNSTSWSRADYSNAADSPSHSVEMLSRRLHVECGVDHLRPV